MGTDVSTWYFVTLLLVMQGYTLELGGHGWAANITPQPVVIDGPISECDKIVNIWFKKQAWAICVRIRIHEYSNTLFRVFVFIFKYFCKTRKVFVFEYIAKVFVFMNTFTNTFEILLFN